MESGKSIFFTGFLDMANFFMGNRDSIPPGGPLCKGVFFNDQKVQFSLVGKARKLKVKHWNSSFVT